MKIKMMERDKKIIARFLKYLACVVAFIFVVGGIVKHFSQGKNVENKTDAVLDEKKSADKKTKNDGGSWVDNVIASTDDEKNWFPCSRCPMPEMCHQVVPEKSARKERILSSWHKNILVPRTSMAGAIKTEWTVPVLSMRLRWMRDWERFQNPRHLFVNMRTGLKRATCSPATLFFL